MDAHVFDFRYASEVTDWCVKKGKIPDTQFGFFPGRSTLHPLFILRHLRHAAKKLKPRNSPRLHVAFIDFSQAYDTVPRQQLWSHLCRSAMPSTLLSVIKHMYENDKYILMDGEKRARASHEWCQTGVLSVPPPFLFVYQWHG